ncbi:unnamed protein product [Bemisia tabaci]|uniref:Uncharacterized protein n=1 Tax=Bemisia tabaci TaxID=7038 RepID=A0A9P0F3V1_BEMTA|nr:unnamed protein product [Bemisia tabaci]
MEEFNWLSRSKGDGQERAALQLCDIAGVNLTFGGSIDEDTSVGSLRCMPPKKRFLVMYGAGRRKPLLPGPPPATERPSTPQPAPHQRSAAPQPAQLQPSRDQTPRPSPPLVGQRPATPQPAQLQPSRD